MSRPGRTRRWWRWLLAGPVLLVVLVVGGAAIYAKSQPAAAPLTLSFLGGLSSQATAEFLLILHRRG